VITPVWKNIKANLRAIRLMRRMQDGFKVNWRARSFFYRDDKISACGSLPAWAWLYLRVRLVDLSMARHFVEINSSPTLAEDSHARLSMNQSASVNKQMKCSRFGSALRILLLRVRSDFLEIGSVYQ
jgi:hypothetical protein